MALEWEILSEGASAAEELLAYGYGVDVRKALNPLNPQDFARITQSLALALKKKTVPVEQDAVKRAMSALDANWVGMAPEGRRKLLAEAAGYLGKPVANQVLPGIDQELEFAAKEIIPTTKSKSVLTHSLLISPDLSATDNRIATYTRISQGHFIRNQYGARADAFGNRARDIVASGLERGLGSADISDRLHRELDDHVQRGRSYWDVIAMVYANRARTMTQLASFQEAGIEDYKWESVLDQVTSVQCRFLHGTVFPVAHAMRKFQEVEDASSPEAIKTLQPFVQLGTDEGGSEHLYYKNEKGDRITIARVEENAFGRANDRGKFSGAHDATELMKAGIHAPPIHGRCRSTIVPEFGSAYSSPAPTVSLPSAPVVPSYTPPIETLPPVPVSSETADNALRTLESMPGPEFDRVNAEGFFYAPVRQISAAKPLPPQTLLNAAEVQGQPLEFAMLTPTKAVLDRDLIETFVKKLSKDPNYAPDLSMYVPRVIQHNGSSFIVNGHEFLAAQKLLGKDIVKAAFVDADEIIAPVVPPPFSRSNGLLDHLEVKDLPKDERVPDAGQAHAPAFRSKVAPRLAGTENDQIAVQRFTGTAYTQIRNVERDEAYALAKYGPSEVKKTKAKIAEIDRFFAAAKPTPMPVYRGIREIKDATLQAFLTEDKFELGATTSTSRTPSVAYDFGSLGYAYSGSLRDDNRVLLILKQKSGVAIETISGIPDEHEILMPRHATFKITARYRARYNGVDHANALVIEAEEIEPANPPAPPKKRRARKPSLA